MARDLAHSGADDGSNQVRGSWTSEGGKSGEGPAGDVVEASEALQQQRVGVFRQGFEEFVDVGGTSAAGGEQAIEQGMTGEIGGKASPRQAFDDEQARARTLGQGIDQSFAVGFVGASRGHQDAGEVFVDVNAVGVEQMAG